MDIVRVLSTKGVWWTEKVKRAGIWKIAWQITVCQRKAFNVSGVWIQGVQKAREVHVTAEFKGSACEA